MKAFLLLLLLAPGRGLSAQAPRRPDDGSRDAVLRLLRSGVSPVTVRAYVESHDLRFSLSADDVVDLKRAGADDALLVFLLDRSALAGEPVSVEDGQIVYEADGVRAFKRRDAKRGEVLVITNLDENGVRLDTPPDIPVEEPSAQSRWGWGPNDIHDDPEVASRPEMIEEEEYFEPPPTMDSWRGAPPPRPMGSGLSAAQAYSPFYQFMPSNVPGPNSPWSPVYSLFPYYDGWNVWQIPTYPVSMVGLPPVYPVPRRRCVR